jgi:hypothetical protein
MGRQPRRTLAGTCSDAQGEWLVAIGDQLSFDIEIRPEDMMDAPEFFCAAASSGRARCSARGCRCCLVS